MKRILLAAAIVAIMISGAALSLGVAKKIYLPVFNFEKDSPQEIRETKIINIKVSEAVNEKNAGRITSEIIKRGKIKNVKDKEIKLQSVSKNKNLVSVKYSQTHSGIPVYGAGSVLIFKGNELKSASSNFVDKISIDTKPNISPDDAVKIIKSETEKNPELVIYPKREKQKISQVLLAYKVDGKLDKNFKAYTYFIDAKTGKIIDKFSRAKSGDFSIIGKVYPENPIKGSQIVDVANEFVNIESGWNKLFYSGSGEDLFNFMQTKETINLTGVSAFNVSFLIEGDKWQSDMIGFEFSPDGYRWGSGGGMIAIPLGSNDRNFPQYISFNLTKENVSMSADNLFWLRQYLLEENQTYFRILYATGFGPSKKGFLIDNISIDATLDDGSAANIFFADADTDENKFDYNGFSIIEKPLVQFLAATDESGVYSFDETKYGNISTKLVGPFVEVVNWVKEDSKYFSTTNYSFNWETADGSYKNEETNVFYHVNRARDFFSSLGKIDMDYQAKANVEFGSELGGAKAAPSCNAFALDGDLYFFGAGNGCESTALGSDIIYHEYTHLVYNSIFNFWFLFTFYPEAGAIEEGVADYFAASITGDSKIGENILQDSNVRDLNNSLKYPNDFEGGTDCQPTEKNDYCSSHGNSRIISGALWDLREMLGADVVDDLLINSLASQYLPPRYFSDILRDIWIYDDIANDGENSEQICNAFKSRGIDSYLCDNLDLYFNNFGKSFYPATNQSWMEVNMSAYIPLTGCSAFVDNSTIIETTTTDNYLWSANLTGLDEGFHTLIGNCTDGQSDYKSYPNLIKFDYSPPTIVDFYPLDGSFVNPEGGPWNILVDEILAEGLKLSLNGTAIEPWNFDEPIFYDNYSTSFVHINPKYGYFSDGSTYALGIEASDLAGNALLPHEITFTVDKTAPTSSVEVSNSTLSGNDSIEISVNGSDSNFDFNAISINYGDSVDIIVSDSNFTYIWNGTKLVLSDGQLQSDVILLRNLSDTKYLVAGFYSQDGSDSATNAVAEFVDKKLTGICNMNKGSSTTCDQHVNITNGTSTFDPVGFGTMYVLNSAGTEYNLFLTEKPVGFSNYQINSQTIDKAGNMGGDKEGEEILVLPDELKNYTDMTGISANAIQTITTNTTSDGIALKIKPKRDFFQERFFIGSYSENPEDVPLIGGKKFVSVSRPFAKGSEFRWVDVSVLYNQTENDYIDEASFGVYFFNETTQAWQREINSGINKTENNFWFNVTHFSLFGINYNYQIPVSGFSGNSTIQFSESNIDVKNKPSYVNLTLNLKDVGSESINFSTPAAAPAALSNGFKLTEINVSSPIKSNLNWALLRIAYTSNDISGLNEDSLGIYYFNETSGIWGKEQTSIVDKTGKYVEANITHFSLYALSGATQTQNQNNNQNNNQNDNPGSGPSSNPGATTTTLPPTTTAPPDEEVKEEVNETSEEKPASEPESRNIAGPSAFATLFNNPATPVAAFLIIVAAGYIFYFSNRKKKFRFW